MTAAGWLPAGAGELFGTEATAEESYGVLTVDVPPASWITALETARDRLGCTFFDWLSAVDEPGTGFCVTVHVAALAPVRRLLLRTTVPHEAPVLPSAVDVYAGAAWHERETHEMFGVDFTGHPGLDHLLLPDSFEGHPLRKDFVLAARVAKAWPGAKEPGESEHGAPKRRQMLPPGVPDPNEWGPQKGQLPPAPTRPTRATAGAAPDRPRRTRTTGEGSASQSATPETPARPRRTRTAAEGSASQSATPESPAGPRRARTAGEGSASQSATPESPAGPRRARTAAEGSASQSAEVRPEAPGSASEVAGTRPESPDSAGRPGGTAPEPPDSASRPAEAPPERRARGASDGSSSQRPGAPTSGGPRRARSASEGSASRRAAPEPSDEPAATADESAPAEDRRNEKPPAAPRSPDAPWHHDRPAFGRPDPKDESQPEADPAREPEGDTATDSDPDPETGAEAGPGAAPGTGTSPEPRTSPEPGAESESGDPDNPTPDDPTGGPR
ncbi:NADH-quinone oxidoreductase subunit C [Streptomyces edwardsiae]|uniref:NADH-quinone oxidoreductase subunit C n=1 Tax=Streptomyces edwardsiae TaxID=3075527 RepID=A0ABU2QDB1_9ACTN|nr:NADH-quinone oxidoreductase subunit C [Streptomyces sp. DSM 41635]MDT0402447.1 NADH-quinone oxidoreductase subunit C [Streptomyces sp. DSM 41635]